MNLAALDLNLLVALDALISEGHVGRAATRIGLSQPAASHALRRLREIMADPLLVRAGGRMQLTRRAEALRGPLAQTLDQVRSLLVADGFDPATSTRSFTLMMSDHVVDLVIPPLLDRIGAQAPGVRLKVTHWRGLVGSPAELARSVDLVIACTTEPLAGFQRQPLFADTEAIAVRRGHVAAARLKHLDAFLEARQVAVVGHGQREDPIDTWLAELGIKRRIAMIVPSYLQALHVVSRTDLVAFVPRRLIEALADSLNLIAIKPPVDPGTYQEYLFHPYRADADPGSIWLRKHIAQIGRTLDRRKTVAISPSNTLHFSDGFAALSNTKTSTGPF